MKSIIMGVYVFTSGIELGRQGGRLPFSRVADQRRSS